MRFRAAFVMLVCAVMMSLVVIDAPASHAGRRVTLDRPRTTPDTVVLRGSAPVGTKVRIVRRSEDGWVRVKADRASRSGRYRVQVARPEGRAWVVRAISSGARSGTRRIAPASAPVVPPPVVPPPVVPPPVVPPPVVPPPVDPPPVDACGEQPAKVDGTWWDCTFVDEFDGAALDSTKWLAQETSFSGITNGPEGCFRNEPWTIAVDQGALRLSAQRTAAPFTCDSPLGSFSTDKVTAAISTKGRFNQAYGRFAFRAKMPSTRVPGAHSALWLYPDKHTYGRWPLSGEIDVAEWYSALPEQVFPSLHYADGDNDTATSWNGVIADVSEFHTYVVEWTPTEMRFFYDDQLVFEHVWTPLAPLTGSQPFDKPFNVVLNQTWGQLWNAPTAETPDRVTMTVDWVRVWK